MVRKLFSILTLSVFSRGWQLAICVFVGIIVGLFVVVGRAANVVSYLSDAPETCMNCHVMTDAYASWQRGSHARNAICVDCHLPQSNFITKTAFKGMDGMKHTAVFLTRNEPQVLRLSDMAVPVVQGNCIRCHDDQLDMIRIAGAEERKCWDCHKNIHGKVHSLSASPSVLRPKRPDAGLPWMEE